MVITKEMFQWGPIKSRSCPVILVAVIKVGDITVAVIWVVVMFFCILDTNLMLIYDRQIIINY